MNMFKSYSFSPAKKRAGADTKFSPTASAQILIRLRLQPKNVCSDRLRNTDYKLRQQ